MWCLALLLLKELPGSTLHVSGSCGISSSEDVLARLWLSSCWRTFDIFFAFFFGLVAGCELCGSTSYVLNASVLDERSEGSSFSMRSLVYICARSF